MTPEEALRNILTLVDGSDEVEGVHALQILLQSIRTLAEKGLGRSESHSEASRSRDCSSRRHIFAPRQRSRIISPGRPASSTVTRSKFMAPVFAFGESMRPKAANYAATMRACSINAARRQRTNLTPS
jgi:hypothetical protein